MCLGFAVLSFFLSVCLSVCLSLYCLSRLEGATAVRADVQEDQGAEEPGAAHRQAVQVLEERMGCGTSARRRHGCGVGASFEEGQEGRSGDVGGPKFQVGSGGDSWRFQGVLLPQGP